MQFYYFFYYYKDTRLLSNFIFYSPMPLIYLPQSITYIPIKPMFYEG